MDVPGTMKAFTIPARSVYTNPDPVSSIVLNPSHPVPKPTATQALIRVHAAAINPFELSWPNSFAPQPRTPCHDISGTVISCPPSSKFSPGDAIFCLLPLTDHGGLAEYAAVEPRFLAKIPKGMGFVEAASLPRPGLTVLEAQKFGVESGWFRSPDSGRRVLITGATGAVGRTAVQIFRDVVGEKGWVGAVGGKGSEMLKEQGADFAISYREEREWEKVVEKEGTLDVVLDCVGGETLDKCLRLVRDEGLVITVASPPPEGGKVSGWVEVDGRRIMRHFFIVSETGEGLEQLAGLAERGIVKPSVSIVVDGLTEEGVREGWAKSEKGGLAGSVVVKIL